MIIRRRHTVGTKPPKWGGRRDYFAVNNRTSGLCTSFRVSGRLGEMASRHMLWDDARRDAKRLNVAYRLGWKHAAQIAKLSRRKTK